MKKFFRIVFCASMSLICLLSLLSCSARKLPTPDDTTTAVKQYITGRYELESIEWSDGNIISGSTLESVEESIGDMYVELYSDATALLSLYGGIREMEFSDDKMTQINYEHNTYDFSVHNGKVVLEQSGDTYTFVKK